MARASSVLMNSQFFSMFLARGSRISLMISFRCKFMVLQPLTTDTRELVVQQYVYKLSTSGYNRNQIRQIVISGLKGYEKRRRREKEEGIHVHRMKHTTKRGRVIRKLMEKNNGFRNQSATATNSHH